MTVLALFSIFVIVSLFVVKLGMCGDAPHWWVILLMNLPVIPGIAGFIVGLFVATQHVAAHEGGHSLR
jgi:ABC-type multidrug transport system permease subunit